jgi:hypothetical protein
MKCYTTRYITTTNASIAECNLNVVIRMVVMTDKETVEVGGIFNTSIYEKLSTITH